MLDVTDNELTVTVRVPEGRWLWLVSLGAGVSLAEWPSLYTATTYLWVSACVRHLLVRVSPVTGAPWERLERLPENRATKPSWWPEVEGEAG